MELNNFILLIIFLLFPYEFLLHFYKNKLAKNIAIDTKMLCYTMLCYERLYKGFRLCKILLSYCNIKILLAYFYKQYKYNLADKFESGNLATI